MSTGSVLDYQAPTKSHSRLAWLGWAIYLAMSWTWCIGMFLPVLLVRDYGVWGWVVFVVPNVVGAAAMGWIISDDEHSHLVVTSHRLAAVAFSFITSSFQVFFALLIFARLQFGIVTYALL